MSVVEAGSVDVVHEGIFSSFVVVTNVDGCAVDELLAGCGD